jgi:hypothetical protein
MIRRWGKGVQDPDKNQVIPPQYVFFRVKNEGFDVLLVVPVMDQGTFRRMDTAEGPGTGLAVGNQTALQAIKHGGPAGGVFQGPADRFLWVPEGGGDPVEDQAP